MPSFDIVSEVNHHELTNAVDQANREIQNRFDFKGVDATYSLDNNVINLKAPTDFQVKQMVDILNLKLTKRGVDVGCLDVSDIEKSLHEARCTITAKEGIDQPTAKKMMKAIKDAKMKVQSSIQGEKIRVTGKKRDDLQETIALLKEGEFGIPLQFDNFRD